MKPSTLIAISPLILMLGVFGICGYALWGKWWAALLPVLAIPTGHLLAHVIWWPFKCAADWFYDRGM